jgi:hypothetical protein
MAQPPAPPPAPAGRKATAVEANAPRPPDSDDDDLGLGRDFQTGAYFLSSEKDEVVDEAGEEEEEKKVASITNVKWPPGSAPGPAPDGAPRGVVSARADPEDPQRGRWGGLPERDNRRLSATVTPLDNGWFKVRLEVRSTDEARYPLRGTVRFHLHDTFKKPRVDVMARNGVAAHEVDAFGPFTVGAEADGQKTALELDLATVEGAPARFLES